MMEKLAQADEGGGYTPAPFHSIYHHVQSFSVRSSWEGMQNADTFILFHLYPYVLSQKSGKGRVHNEDNEAETVGAPRAMGLWRWDKCQQRMGAKHGQTPL